MFKNMTVYRIAPEWACDLTLAEEALAGGQFAECGATQERSVGWVPPRGDANGPLVESVGGQWIMRFMSESKVVPGSVIARRVKEKASRIEQETGRKPGKKESKELKEEAMLDLLPMAFTKQGSMWVWIDREARTLVLDTSSQGRADEVVSALIERLPPGFAVSLVHTQTSPSAAMAYWLVDQDPPTGFSVDRECELKSADEAKAVVRYARHPLDIEEVQGHIAQGKMPTHLALTWDDRVSFLLTEGLQIKKLAFLDAVFVDKSTDESGFDTDVAIATGELRKFIPDLLTALGGETEPGAMQAQSAHTEQSHEQIQVPEHDAGDEGPDPAYDMAVEVVRTGNKGSISYVQRKLRIGYNRAARLLERMQQEGVVGVMNADGARPVLAAHAAAA